MEQNENVKHIVTILISNNDCGIWDILPYSNNEYDVMVSVTEENIDKIKEYDVIEDVIESLDNIISESEDIADEIEKPKRYFSKLNSYMDTCEYITVPLNYLDKIIEKNPFLKNKKICIDNELELKEEDYNYIQTNLKKYNNVYIKIEGNNNISSIKEYEDTYEAINIIVDKIKKYNLSQLEQIMYAYDLVRERIYTKENEDEFYEISRDLTNVLLGDKIVCVGYANIFNAVLGLLGIPSILDYVGPNIINLIRNKSCSNVGHCRNIVYVNDSKYNVNGIFYFDTTIDSKRNENDIKYLNSYKAFCLNKGIMSDIGGLVQEVTLKTLNEYDFLDIIEILKENGINELPKEIPELINIFTSLVEGEKYLDPILCGFKKEMYDELPENLKIKINIEELTKLLEKYDNYFYESDISLKNLFKLIYQVRKIEYLEECEKYPLDINSIKEAIDKRSRYINDNFTEEMNEYIENNELEKEIERIKLSKTLKLVLGKKCSK